MQRIRDTLKSVLPESSEELTADLLQNQLYFPHLYFVDQSSGNINTCRPLKPLVIR